VFRLLFIFLLGGFFVLFLTDTSYREVIHGFEQKIVRPIKGNTIVIKSSRKSEV